MCSASSSVRYPCSRPRANARRAAASSASASASTGVSVSSKSNRSSRSLNVPQCVGRQEEHPRDVQLGVNDYRQIAKLQCADSRAGLQAIDIQPRRSSLFDGKRRHCRAQRIMLTRREFERLARDVLPQVNPPHRFYRPLSLCCLG